LKEDRRKAELMHDQAALEIIREAERGYADGGATGLWNAMLKAQKSHLGEGASEYDLAVSYVALEKKQEAIRNLEIAIDKHYPVMIGIRNDVKLRALHGEPGFARLLARLGLPPL